MPRRFAVRFAVWFAVYHNSNNPIYIADVLACLLDIMRYGMRYKIPLALILLNFYKVSKYIHSKRRLYIVPPPRR